MSTCNPLRIPLTIPQRTLLLIMHSIHLKMVRIPHEQMVRATHQLMPLITHLEMIHDQHPNTGKVAQGCQEDYFTSYLLSSKQGTPQLRVIPVLNWLQQTMIASQRHPFQCKELRSKPHNQYLTCQSHHHVIWTIC